MAGSLPRRVASVQRRGDPIEEAVGDLALGQERQGVGTAGGIEDRDPVRVGPEAGAGLAHVVGDEEVDALPAELLRGPVERAGLRREADEDRAADRTSARVGSPPLSRPWAIRATSARRSGVGVSSRARPSPRAIFRSAGLTRREIGDGGGHDQGIEPGTRRRRPTRRTGRPGGRPQLAGRLDPDHPGAILGQRAR